MITKYFVPPWPPGDFSQFEASVDNKGHRAVDIFSVTTPSSPALRIQIFEPCDVYPDAKRCFNATKSSVISASGTRLMDNIALMPSLPISTIFKWINASARQWRI